MNTQSWRFDLSNFKIARVIAPIAIAIGVGAAAAPLSAQVVTIENRSGAIYRSPANNSIIYTSPLPSPVNSSIVYGSPIPAPVIINPNSFYSYPSYYPGSVTRVIDNRRTLTNPVLINPTIRDSTLINPTIIKVQPQRRNRIPERNTTILRPINY